VSDIRPWISEAWFCIVAIALAQAPQDGSPQLAVSGTVQVTPMDGSLVTCEAAGSIKGFCKRGF